MSKIGQLKKLSLTGPHTETILFNTNEAGDVVTDDLYLELENDVEVSAIGYSLKSTSGIPLKFVKVSDFSIPDVVEEAGLYLLMVSAYEKVEITFNAPQDSEGSVTCRATIKTTYGG